MLDVSGSMKEPDASGVSKLKAAQTAMTSVVKTLPPTTHVGLRVYGATVGGGKPTPAACADTQLAHPLTPLDKPGLTKLINSYKPKGETPVAFALSEALKDLGSDGERNLILLSDGKESCVPDPCPAIRKLIGAGINLRLDTVGVAVDAEARKQLQCLAEAGHGQFYDAKDTDQLISALGRLAPPPVDNTIAGTLGTKESPVISAGQYRDTSAANTQTATDKWYRIQRRLPGSAVHVSAVAPVEAASDPGAAAQRASWSYELLTAADKTSCARMDSTETDSTGMGVLAVGSVVAQPLDPLANVTVDSDEAKCAEAKELLLHIRRSKGIDRDQPLEISVLEEPGATNAGTLPRGVSDVSSDSVKAYQPSTVADPAQKDGGFSFNDAALVTPGSYVTSVVPGSIVFFKAAVDWGQQATFAVDGPTPSFVAEKTPADSIIYVSGNLYAPDRGRIDSEQQSSYAIYHGGRLAGPAQYNVVPSVRYRNRWDSPAMYFDSSHGFSMAGDYYFAISVGADSADGALKGVPVPIRFSVGVDGTPTGAPAYAEKLVVAEAQQDPEAALATALKDLPTAPPPPQAALESGNRRAWALGTAGLLAAAAAAFMLLRRRTEAHVGRHRIV